MLPSRVVGRRYSLLWLSDRPGRRRVAPWMAALHQSQAGTGVCPAGVGSRGHPAPGDTSWCGCTTWHGISPSLVSTMAGRGRGRGPVPLGRWTERRGRRATFRLDGGR